MFPDRHETSQESDSHSQCDPDGKQRPVNCGDRKEVDNISKKTESGHDVFHCPAVHEVQKNQRDQRADNSDQQTLEYEGCPDETILGADIFHDSNLFSTHGNAHGNRIADQEYGDNKQ